MREAIKIIVLSAVICLSITEVLCAQDLHFSQFFNSPLTENPANTGFSPEANYRLGAQYRDQWSAVPVPYKTFSIYGDAQLMQDQWYSGWLGVGGVILQDNSAGGALKSTKAYASVAYHQLLSESSLLSLGFNGGIASKRLDLSKVTFPDQFNFGMNEWFFDHSIGTGAQINRTSISYLDLQVGMNYAYFPTDNIYLNLGFSAHHVNRPREAFVTGSDNEIDRRYIGFLNANIKISPKVILNPNAYYSTQRGAHETVIGAWVAYNLSGPGGDYQLLGGAYYRFNDAFAPLIGYQLKQWRIMFSYDVTTSSFSNVNQRKGAYELSLTFFGLYSKGPNYNKKQYICPHF